MKVKVTEKISAVFKVEAKSKEEAEEKIKQKYYEGDIVINPGMCKYPMIEFKAIE